MSREEHFLYIFHVFNFLILITILRDTCFYYLHFKDLEIEEINSIHCLVGDGGWPMHSEALLIHEEPSEKAQSSSQL